MSVLRRVKPSWLGLALGVGVALVTDSLLAGVLVGAALALILGQLRRVPAYTPSTPHPKPDRARATSITVVCKAVTPERQEWVSSKTGRLYDVLSRHGLPDAQPGDEGMVVLTPSGWRIEAKRRADTSFRRP